MSVDIVVDFKEYGLDVKDTSVVSDDTLKTLGKRIVNALKTHGYCYLTNHGVDDKLIKRYMKVSRKFFDQPIEEKEKHPLGHDCGFGWLKMEGERLTPEREPGDYKETFNYTPFSGYEAWLPVENFEALTKQFFETGTALALRFCDVLSLGLDLPKDFMRNAHKLVGQKGNSSQIRTLLYPPILPDSNIKPGQARLGEHIDYGSVSFNFQDDVGGLEILSPDGKFVPVVPKPGTTVVFTSILLQRWTSDFLVGTKHRILIPEDEERKKKFRQSLIYFLVPDNELVIKCLDGSDKYEPITSRAYVDYKLKDQYL